VGFDKTEFVVAVVSGFPTLPESSGAAKFSNMNNKFSLNVSP
jgi:hypothetical protein